MKNMTSEYTLTPEGYEKLKKELEYLEKVERPKLARELEEEIAVGDLSENSQYHELKDKQAWLEDRIREIREILRTAKVVKRRKGGNTVRIGSEVEIELGGQKMNYQIVGDAEADPFEGKISPSSPLGSVLMGKKVGEEFIFERPDGQKIKGKILQIK